MLPSPLMLRLFLCLVDAPAQLLLLLLQQRGMEDLVVYGLLLLQLAASTLQQQQQQRHAIRVFVGYAIAFAAVVVGCFLVSKQFDMPSFPAASLLLLVLRFFSALTIQGCVLHLLVLGWVVVS